LELRFGTDRNEETAPLVAKLGDRIEVLPDRILLYTENGEKALEHVMEAGLKPVTSLVRRASLEDVFLRLTGRSLVD
jgi:lipooligosaccharide transport system ATP-binding protein